MLYTITDVQVAPHMKSTLRDEIVVLLQDLHLWMAGHLEAHPLFERVSEEELVRDLINSVSVTYSSLPDRAA